MVCSTVSKRLSEFFDGMLDDELSIRISQHLKQCDNCRKELEALSNMHESLNSLARIPAPEYLYHLVQTRLSERKNNTWRRQIRDSLALRWSRIRTTEVQFYWTRALGIAMTTFFLFVLSSSLDPFYPGSFSQATGRSIVDKSTSERVWDEFSRNFGVYSMKPLERNYGPALHPQYLLDIGESASGDSDEYNCSLVIEVDSNGTGTIQNVLESPGDQGVLNNIKAAIAMARFRPGFRDGRPVSSLYILKNSKTTVYE